MEIEIVKCAFIEYEIYTFKSENMDVQTALEYQLWENHRTI